jgi:hypothetical protein
VLVFWGGGRGRYLPFQIERPKRARVGIIIAYVDGWVGWEVEGGERRGRGGGGGGEW